MRKTYWIIIIIFSAILITIFYIRFSTDKDSLIRLINNFNNDSDCIIVSLDYCGSPLAINKAHLDVWNKHLESERLRLENKVIYGPSLPLGLFEARCINNKCETQAFNQNISI